MGKGEAMFEPLLIIVLFLGKGRGTNAIWVKFAHFVSYHLACYPNPNPNSNPKSNHNYNPKPNPNPKPGFFKPRPEGCMWLARKFCVAREFKCFYTY